jgi:hypothetical protein
MAGDWIKMRGNLWDDPRVAKLCDLTDQGEAAVIGGLYWLWATADQHSEDGMMPGLTIRQIDRKTGVPGLGEALLEISWIAEREHGIEIVRFEEHNGSSAKKRCQTAKRVSKHKTGNAKVTQPALPESNHSVSGALPREREREDIEKDCANAQSKKIAAAAAPASQGDQPHDHQSKPKRFRPPQLRELVESFAGRVPDPVQEAQAFVNHYESVGWRVGKNPMKSWPHAVNNWISRRSEYAARQPGTVRPSRSERDQQAFYEYIGQLDDSEPQDIGVSMGGSALSPVSACASGKH